MIFISLLSRAKSKTHLVPLNFLKVFKRTMLKTVFQSGKTEVSKIVHASIPRHYYAGEFRGRVWDKNLKYPVNLHERNDLGLTEHQATHINIEFTSTETITMILTSSSGKNNEDPNIYFEKLSSIKADGSFIPLKNAKTGKLEFDINGNLIPDPNKGGQYVAVLVTPRKLGEDIKHKATVDIKLQKYLDQHENDLKRILANAEKYRYKVPSKMIGDKDAE